MLRIASRSSRCAATVTLAALALNACGGGSATPDSATADSAREDRAMDAPIAPQDSGADAVSAMDSGADAAPLDATLGDTGVALDAPNPDAAADEPDVIDLPDTVAAETGPACSPGWQRCGGECVDLSSYADHCGACGRSCRGPNVLGAACTSAVCAVTACDVGFVDLDRVADNGCEAAQDFAIALDSASVAVNTGSTASVAVSISRQNGFPYAISVDVLGPPAGLSVTPVTLSTDARVTLALSASPVAIAGTYTVMVNAIASVAGRAFVHALPLTVQIVRSSVSVTSVQVLKSGVALPMNQAPQGAGLLTVRVRGSGLLSVVSAQVGTFSLTDLPGATDAQRDYELAIPHATPVDAGQRALDLVLRTSGGALGASYSSALVLTDIRADPRTGNDVSGVGSWASPVQSIDRAFALAAAGDTVSLAATDHAPPARVAPAGLNFFRGNNGRILCPTTPGSTTGLRAASSLRVLDTQFIGCNTALAVDDGAAGTVTVRGSRIEGSITPFAITTLTALEVTDSVLIGTNMPLRFTTGTVTFRTSAINNYALEAAGARLVLDSARVSPGAAGNAVVIGPSATPSALYSTVIEAPMGDGIVVRPAARLTLDRVSVSNAARGLVVDGGNVTAPMLSISNVRGAGVTLTGANPTLALGLPASLSFVYDVTGAGVLVSPSAGTATLSVENALFERNGVGIDVQNGAGTTTALSIRSAMLRGNGAGLRVAGGTTNLEPASFFDGELTRATQTLVELVSGAGTIAISQGTWRIPQGTGLSIEGASQHTVRLGGLSRALSLDLSGHGFDGTFGLIDGRATMGEATSARVRFVGSDGAPRVWSGAYANTGSYSVSVSPRDPVCWRAVYNGRIDFGAP